MTQPPSTITTDFICHCLTLDPEAFNNAVGPLTQEQRYYLRGRRYRHQQESPPRLPGALLDRLAKEMGIGTTPLRKAVRFADAVDVIAREAGPEAMAKILSGELGLSRPEVGKLATLPAAEQLAALAGGKRTVRAATQDNEPVLATPHATGLRHAHAAIACLKRISQHDPLRKRGFQVVTDWIRRNQ